MGKRRLIATGRVRVTLEIKARSTWGLDCRAEQIDKQARDEVNEDLARLFAKDLDRVVMIGKPTVQAVIVGEDANDVEDAKAALKAQGEEPLIPWSDVEKKLDAPGWTAADAALNEIAVSIGIRPVPTTLVRVTADMDDPRMLGQAIMRTYQAREEAIRTETAARWKNEYEAFAKRISLALGAGEAHANLEAIEKAAKLVFSEATEFPTVVAKILGTTSNVVVGEIINHGAQRVATNAIAVLEMQENLGASADPSNFRGQAKENAKLAREAVEMTEKYEAAIRKHRDQKGDDRCWIDDRELYAVLPEGYAGFGPQLDEPEEMLANCKRYIASRHDETITYLSPAREIEKLRAEVARLGRELEVSKEATRSRERDLVYAQKGDVDRINNLHGEISRLQKERAELEQNASNKQAGRIAELEVSLQNIRKQRDELDKHARRLHERIGVHVRFFTELQGTLGRISDEAAEDVIVGTGG
jgi:FtsZ-binding cell division protein ZapB